MTSSRRRVRAKSSGQELHRNRVELLRSLPHRHMPGPRDHSQLASRDYSLNRSRAVDRNQRISFTPNQQRRRLDRRCMPQSVNVEQLTRRSNNQTGTRTESIHCQCWPETRACRYARFRKRPQDRRNSPSRHVDRWCRQNQFVGSSGVHCRKHRTNQSAR